MWIIHVFRQQGANGVTLMFDRISLQGFDELLGSFPKASHQEQDVMFPSKMPDDPARWLVYP